MASYTPTQLKALAPSDLAAVNAAVLSEHQTDINAAGAGVTANAADIVTNAAGIATNTGDIATNVAGIAALQPVPEATVTWNAALSGGTTVTVTVDTVLEATLTLNVGGGGGTARTGANAATIDIGGGVGGDAQLAAGDLAAGLRLIGDTDAVNFTAEPLAPAVVYTAAAGGIRNFHLGGGIRIKVPAGSTLVVATDDAGLTVVNPT